MNWLPNEEHIKCIKLFKKALKETEDNSFANDKIMTLYIDFLQGWLLKPEKDAEIIRKECSLPWNREEFAQYFEKYNREHGNKYDSEGHLQGFARDPYKLKKSGNIPDIAKNLADDDWFELQNRDFNLLAIGTVTEDSKASDKSATILYTTQHEWSMQRDLSGNLPDFKKRKTGKIELYGYFRSVDKKTEEGEVLTFGIYDEKTKTKPFSKNIEIKDLNDEKYVCIPLGIWEIGDTTNSIFYLSGYENPKGAKGVAIDRIIGIFK